MKYNHIYEYYIYPPKCDDINRILNGIKIYNLDLDDLFEKTNTKYYLFLDSNSIKDLKININDNQLDKKNQLKSIKTFLIFTSDQANIINNIEINYNISIDETYSD